MLNKVPFELTAAIIGLAVSATTLGATFGAAHLMQVYAAHHAPPPAKPDGNVASSELVSQGRHLFLTNCAHCHADDATGDEGPDLHGVRKSDARITAIIKNGIKGEMPKFGQKLKDDDVHALIAFIRSLE